MRNRVNANRNGGSDQKRQRDGRALRASARHKQAQTQSAAGT